MTRQFKLMALAVAITGAWGAGVAAEVGETLPGGVKLQALSIEPDRVVLDGGGSYTQMVFTAVLESGDTVDVTRIADATLTGAIAEIGGHGRIEALGDGSGELIVRVGGLEERVPVSVSSSGQSSEPDYVRDVMPVISKMGCNSGTCHGSKDGRAGFKLSLRGYDPLFDVRAFADDLGSRRVNSAVPDRSLMLLKATAAVPHEGGQLTKPGSPYYNVIRGWIASGARLDLESAKVSGIEVFPKNPVVETVGAKQQVRVVATYSDGSRRDVTREAFVESGNTEVVVPSEDYTGLVTTLRRGEAPLLVRYEGQYAATTVTVMGDRAGFEWLAPPTNNEIDVLVAAKLRRVKSLSSPLCNDYEFVRRVHLDLTGLPPTPEAIEAFVADRRDSRWKREQLIDRLIGSEEFVDYWTNKWADLLQVNGKFLGREGASAFRTWIRGEIEANTPYDSFVRKILTASGSNKDNPPASYYKVLRTAEDAMENTTHLFLATRFNCNKCHDHPFERWTQDNYYEMAAYFARVSLKRDEASGDKKIGGTAVEGAKPLYEIVFEKPEGEIVHERTGVVTAPAFPYQAGSGSSAEGELNRREELAGWITSPDNPYFASSYVNRVWGYLMGRGLIEPIDDIRAGNPPTNPELLEWLTTSFVDSGFNVRELMRAICSSRTYQLSVETNQWNEDDELNYSHAKARRLPAEVLYDSIFAATGATSKIPGVPPGTRAAALPDVGVKLADGFLGNLGRPVRESACECERSSELQLGPVMALISGPTVGDALSDQKNAIAELAGSGIDDRTLVERLFMRILNRPGRAGEIDAATQMMRELPAAHEELVAELHAYAEEISPSEERRRADRQNRISEAAKNLAAYEEQIAPREAELNRKAAETVARLGDELREREKELADEFDHWQASHSDPVEWEAVDVTKFHATAGSDFEVLDDGSVLVTGKNGKGAYEIEATSSAVVVTGIKLEALADERLPKSGPGRADSGNFVLNEIEAFLLKGGGDDAAEVPLGLAGAKADFSQGGYEVAKAIDGKLNAAQNDGWAIHPKVGETRSAVFELKETAEIPEGGKLRFKLHQHYTDGKHSLGRFRILVTRQERPGLLLPPEEIAEILKIAGAERTEPQVKQLKEFFLATDANWLQASRKLAEASKPRPVDPELKRLRDALSEEERPFEEDAKLVRLRGDVALSEAQLKNQRLTAAQDIAWALINTPAFLFNY